MVSRLTELGRQLAGDPPNRSRFTLLATLLVLLAIVAYLPAINAGFIWDDDVLLTANSDLQNVHGLSNIWLGKGTFDYTPLTLTTFWFEKKLWGDIPTGYHVANILLHALAAFLLWRILDALRIPGAWFAALLFAIHPVNVASVAWIAERKNVLSGALFFGSILGFISYYKRGGIAAYLFSIALFLMAALSKGAVVTMPAVLCLCVLWLNRRIALRDLVKLVPFVVIAVLISFLTIQYQSRAPDFGLVPVDWSYRIARAGVAIWFYLGGILLPVHLSPMAPQWLPDLHSTLVYMPALLVVIALGFLVWIRNQWNGSIIFACGYYLLMLLPVLGFVRIAFQQETPCADWWQYLAVPGILAIVAAGVATLSKTFTHNGARIILRGLLCLIVTLLLAQTMRRSATYHSMETYCRAALAENPHAWTLQNNLGFALKQRGEFYGAVACYRAALKDNPRFVEAHNNLGNALAAMGQWEEARAELREALRLNPSSSVVRANLINAYRHRDPATRN